MSRPTTTTCPSCSKRLSKKHWYYRNGQYYCKRACWQSAVEKAKEEQAKAQQAKEEAAKVEPPKPTEQPATS